MPVDKENFLKREKIENRAVLFYKEIPLLNSWNFQYILGLFIFYNLLTMLMVQWIQFRSREHLFSTMRERLIIIIGEVVILHIMIILYRISELKFNRLVKEGVVLKTIIVKNQSRELIRGHKNALQIYSYYISEDGTRLIFEQIRHLNISRISDSFICGRLEKKLNNETYINVLVNPEKCKEYYMMIDEIGVAEEDKYNVPYAKKNVSKVLLFILFLEYVIWLLWF